MTGYSDAVLAKVNEVVLDPLLGLAVGILDTVATRVSMETNGTCHGRVTSQDNRGFSSAAAYIFIMVVAAATYFYVKKIYHILFKPLDRVRRLGSIG